MNWQWQLFQRALLYPRNTGMVEEGHAIVDNEYRRNQSAQHYPHESNALAPAVLHNGDIVFVLECHENKTLMHTANSTTLYHTEQMALCRTDGNGADGTVILNGHKSSFLKTQLWPAVRSGDE
jgi:hypothetical protein